MPLRKATLRRMPPQSRKYARLLGELESVHRRLKNMLVEVQRLELDSLALAHAKDVVRSREDTLFTVTKEDVIACAREMGVPEKALTDDVLRNVKKGLEAGLEYWPVVVKEAINLALKS